jgi:hypothetical protein
MYVLLRSIYLTGIFLDLRWLPSEATPLVGTFGAFTITPTTCPHTSACQSFLSQAPDHWTTGHSHFHRCAQTLEVKADYFRNVVCAFDDIGKVLVYFNMFHLPRVNQIQNVQTTNDIYFSISDVFIHSVLTNMFRPAFPPSSGRCYYKNTNIQSCK